MTNFSFIPSQWAKLSQTAIDAEKKVYGAPDHAAMLCRRSLEEWVRWMYENDADLTLPYDKSLNTLIHEQEFKETIAPLQFNHINFIRKLGNNAVHTSAKIKPQEALQSLQLLHGFIVWITKVYSDERPVINAFDESILPRESDKDKTKDELRKLETAYLEQQDKLVKLEAELAIIKSIKEKNISHVLPPINPNEDLTRTIYINTLLHEAGWDPNIKNGTEYPVYNCMPQADGSAGNGFVDYVLWGDDGKPVALVEAKRTRRDPTVGQHQAKCYADCLQKEFGQRPVIYYSNGFQTWMWDDNHYAPREVYGFYTKDELQMLIQRRITQKPLEGQTINAAITDRYYQVDAIRKVNEALEKRQRDALLVMATGAGKTRVAASIIDLLSKANWVKRVLFLADRNALIHQAKVNFNDYLPHLPAVDLTKEKEDESSRIVFSTYQTMINMIDGEYHEDSRYYSVGHFDLIIFDEIHRSVYNRYRHIFKYFDGIRLGLTATPKAEGDKDTYGLFGLQPNNPTFAYELGQAVSDGFLVPPKAIAVPIKFQRKGIKYAELSEDEKRNYEEQFTDPLTGAFPDEIDSSALNQWVFNTDTVDKVLAHLMTKGIKVEGGDKLAETIIFARSHKHAKFIQERFDKQYPEYRGHFLQVIDYQEEYKYDLLNKFKVASNMPQIAVSVDMLDTGIDVPEVANLVFFKIVRSSSKYWQMIGRGTRLCKDLFGPGDNKTEFIIFDFCDNFEFFGNKPEGVEGSSSKSLSQHLFEIRLRLAFVLLHEQDSELKEYGQSIIDGLIKQTQALNGESFVVRQHWEVVEKYRDPNAWNALNDLDMKQLFDHIGPLMTETDQDEMAKRFDALMLDIQLNILNGSTKQVQQISNVVYLAGKLSKKGSIPSVAQKMDLIREIQQKNFWESVSIITIDKVRKDLRDLIKFIDPTEKATYVTTFDDEMEGNVKEYNVVYHVNNLDAYKRRVEQYLKEQSSNIIIHKLTHNVQITKDELMSLEEMLFDQGTIGTKEEFTKAYGDQPLGKFIRHILGMDINAAKLAFGEILTEQTLNGNQIQFIDTIINYLNTNGVIDPKKLFEAPFTDINSGGILGLFDEMTSTKIISLIQEINQNAEVG
ncbi:MAG TPA: DEAD/DEAH box helicase family protein [Saprospiraceae bacterium]|nr:DEAD/DEAH box helicase family protein [Saprospiraceae bacterium]